MSTDALALAQLELLYRLGVLERERPPSYAPSSSSRQRNHHYPQPRAIANARRAHDGSDDEELRSVSTHHASKNLDGNADYDNYGPLYTSSRAQAYGSVHKSSHHRARHPVEPRPSQKARAELARMWFLYWKLFVRNARERRNIRAIWRFRLTKRVMKRWKCLAQHQQRFAIQIRMLQEWKAIRMARKWHLWATNHHCIQLLLDNTRFALMNRLRRRRVWLRWLRFASQSRNQNIVLDKQLKIRNVRRLRASWLELKVFVCTSRQAKRGLYKVLQALRLNREMADVKQRSLYSKRVAIQRNVVKRLLWRWRMVVVRRNSKRRVRRQVELEISRRRYWRIWRECLSDNHCITEFRARYTTMSTRRHLFAWCLAAKALRMAHKRSVWTHKATRERYFRAWKTKAALTRRCRRANHKFERVKLANALGRLRFVAVEGRGFRQIEGHWRLRTLTKVWRLGFLKFHQQQQDARLEQKSLELQARRRFFAKWLEFRRMKNQKRARRRTAGEVLLRNRLCGRFASWKELWRQRKLANERIARGDQFYHSQLMLKGVFKMSALVAQRNENAEIGRRIRRQSRLLMKTRILRAWTQWTQHKRRGHSQVMLFQAGTPYQRSWFNPLRRVWSTWREFTASQAWIKRADVIFHLSLKRKCLRAWHRRARIARAAFIFQQLQSLKTLESSFANWRSRTSHWQKIREVFALADTVYRRKRCGKILREWAHWARRTGVVRRRHRHLAQIASLKILTGSFQVWALQYQLCTKVLRFVAERQNLLRTRCLRAWHLHVTKHIKLKRKLGYFQQVFGKHPTTSLVRRVWLRWIHYTSTILGIKVLCRRQQYREIRTLWKQWTFFHLYTKVFREWRRVAAHSALENHEFGKRLRQFHSLRRDLLRTRVFQQWQAMYRRKQSERELLKTAKHRILQAIVSRSRQHTQARSNYMRKWFSRWRKGVSVRCNAAIRYYKVRLARKMLVVWWRVMVNAKQELVLSEAKQVLGTMSFYHPQQKLYTQIVKEKALAMRAASDLKREQRPHHVKMKKMRRMLDPEEKPTYAAYRHQEPGRARHDTANVDHQNVVVDLRHVGFQTSVKEINKVGFTRQSPPKLKSTHQEHQQNSESNHQDEEMHSRQHCLSSRAVLRAEPSLEEASVIRRSDASYRVQNRKQPAESRSDESASYSQQTHPKMIRQPQELPLFDPQICPRPPKATSSSRHDKTHARKDAANLRHRRDGLPNQHHEQAMIFKTRTATDHHELPLFDEEQNQRGTRPSSAPVEQQQLRSTTVTRLNSPQGSVQENESPPPAPPLSSYCSHQRQHRDPSTTTGVMAYYGEISLDQLASMGAFSTNLVPQEGPRRLVSVHPTQPLQSSTFTSEPRRIRAKEAESRSPQLMSVSSEPLSLSAILELPERGHQLTHKQDKLAEALPAVESYSINPSGDMLSEVLIHYAQPLVEFAAQDKTSRTNFKTRRQQICFKMLRDLGLFHNQFYFPQMDSVMNIISTEHISIVHKRLKASIDGDDTEYLEQVEGEYLKRFLIKVIENHPLYIQYTTANKSFLSGNCSRHSPDSTIDQVELQWLVHVHLQPRVSEQSTSRHQRNGKLFWVNFPLPSEVESALPKLLLCISKYFKVLAQLFSTNRASQKQSSNTLRQLTKSEFVQLLKHVHVFPQLLNRREAESAFEASCCQCFDQKELSFPEFVEALVRCSASLQWGEAATSKGSVDDSNGVVVKFLMLLFAMEGRGSVLQKRNEDLKVVVGYLEQKQAQQKTGRMVRFKKLLADQKLNGVRRPANRSWIPSQLNSGRSSINSRSPLQDHDAGNLFYCAAESRGGNLSYNQEGEHAMILGVLGENRGYHHFEGDHLYSITDTGGDDSGGLSYQNELASPPDTEEWREGFLHSPGHDDVVRLGGKADDREQQSSRRPVSVDLDDVREDALPAEDFEILSVATGIEVTRSATISANPQADRGTTDAILTKKNEQDTVSVEAPPNSSYRVGELRDKNEFLNDILSSIGDVELVLQQSNLQLRRQQSHGTARALDPTELALTSSQRKPKSVDEYSDDFENEDAGNVTANIVRTLFTDVSDGFLFHHMDTADSLLLLDQVEDVCVNDPMLNQLTDIERFTDSTDWRAYPTLENIAELGIHATAPTSRFKVTPVQNSDLNCLTDTTHTIGAYEEDEGALEAGS